MQHTGSDRRGRSGRGRIVRVIDTTGDNAGAELGALAFVLRSASSLLEYRMAQHGHESLGFSVHVPHYLAQTDYPEAAQTLLENFADNAGLDLPLSALGEAAARVREQVAEHIAGNEEVETVVTALERQYDSFVTAQERQSSLLAADGELPSGEELGAEFERFLAEQGGYDDTSDEGKA